VRRLEDWKLAPVEQPTDAQRAAFKDWTGQELPASTEAKPAAPEHAPH
jgi:hypothetical protein